MARINLLPWREEKRRDRQRQFMTSLLLTAILGVVLVFFTGFAYDQKITHQEVKANAKSEAIYVPELAKTLIEQIGFEARENELIDPKSGVSARMSITMYENLISGATYRMLVTQQEKTSVRMSDFLAVIPARVDIETDPVLRFVQENSLEKRTIGVLTKVDLMTEKECKMLQERIRNSDIFSMSEYIINYKIVYFWISA